MLLRLFFVFVFAFQHFHEVIRLKHPIEVGRPFASILSGEKRRPAGGPDHVENSLPAVLAEPGRYGCPPPAGADLHGTQRFAGIVVEPYDLLELVRGGRRWRRPAALARLVRAFFTPVREFLFFIFIFILILIACLGRLFFG